MNRFRNRDVKLATKNQRRSGISLIETIACVAIVGAMSTGVVSVMRSSIRLAAHANGISGAPATARQTLRSLSDHIRNQSIASTQPRRSTQLHLADGTVHRFDIRPSSAARGGRDLVMIDASGTETVWVTGAARQFQITRLDSGGNLAGLQLQLVLRMPDEEAARLRPDAIDADVTTTVCLSPQL